MAEANFDLELNTLLATFPDLQERIAHLKKYFNFDEKVERLEEVNAELSEPNVWNDVERAQELGKEKASLDATINELNELSEEVFTNQEMVEMLLEDNNLPLAEMEELYNEMQALTARVETLEFKSMFNQPQDHCNCFIDFNAGSGGTEAQDWTEMLIRMYCRWAESKGFKVEEVDYLPGEVAGVKSATYYIQGEYAFGYLRTETGVHRLVRKSPFNANGKRHTSFSAVYVYPEIDDSIEVEINPADLRIDVYRASGAGGQHVNKTESAVRITHLPTNIVVSSQTSRSQHQNKESCMKQLKAKLYELELQKRQAVQKEVEENKSENGWGSQIRSYVLDDSRIKDLRTGVEVRDTASVLNGDLDKFLEEQLKQGL